MSNHNPQIAFFIHSLNCGGVERNTVNLIHNFVKKGYKVDLLLRSVEGEYLSQLPPQIRIIKLGNGFNGLLKLINYLKKEQPLNLFSAMYPINEMAILAKHLAKSSTRIVVSVRTTLSCQEDVVQFRWAVLNKIHAPWVRFLAKLFYPWADEIVLVSHAAAQDFVQVTGISLSRIQIIYNPVITPELLEKSKHSLDHPWFQQGEPPVILAVGRLHQMKDFSNLIRAFAMVRQVKPARLMILGTGPQEKQLKALVRELGLEQDVVLPGFVDNPYVYMVASAVLVLSSVGAEALPTVLIEAMALGTPLVSTNCASGPEEILAGGKYGELVPVGDSQAMAEAIKRVLTGNIKSVDAAWLEQFSTATATQKYINLFSK
jgi:glycosyltransferase involved in cell wall biosynthesis